jgi:hypothetical protein
MVKPFGAISCFGRRLGGTQLSRHEPVVICLIESIVVICLIESIEEIGCTPETEDPCNDNAGTPQLFQQLIALATFARSCSLAG